ncbi:20470_t:CDS:2, partial [Funneliformis geosporum]
MQSNSPFVFKQIEKDKNKLSSKLTTKELDNLCQLQAEVTQLKLEIQKKLDQINQTFHIENQVINQEIKHIQGFSIEGSNNTFTNLSVQDNIMETITREEENEQQAAIESSLPNTNNGNILKGASVANNTAESSGTAEEEIIIQGFNLTETKIDSEEENISTSKFKEKSSQPKDDEEFEELLKKSRSAVDNSMKIIEKNKTDTQFLETKIKQLNLKETLREKLDQGIKNIKKIESFANHLLVLENFQKDLNSDYPAAEIINNVYTTDLPSLTQNYENIAKSKIRVPSQSNLNDYIKPLDIVRVDRKRGTYQHVAIYLGRNETEIEVHHPFIPFKRSELIRKHIEVAEKARYGEGKYSLIDSNCEHFATMCVYGIGVCQQKNINTVNKVVKNSNYLLQAIQGNQDKVIQITDLSTIDNTYTALLHNLSKVISATGAGIYLYGEINDRSNYYKGIGGTITVVSLGIDFVVSSYRERRYRPEERKKERDQFIAEIGNLYNGYQELAILLQGLRKSDSLEEFSKLIKSLKKELTEI